MAVRCKKCGGDHPTWDCKASAAKIAAWAQKQSEVTRPAAQEPEASASAPATKSTASSAKRGAGIKPRPSIPNGEAAPDATKRKDTRKGDRHRPGYWSTYQRPDRAPRATEEGT